VVLVVFGCGCGSPVVGCSGVVVFVCLRCVRVGCCVVLWVRCCIVQSVGRGGGVGCDSRRMDVVCCLCVQVCIVG